MSPFLAKQSASSDRKSEVLHVDIMQNPWTFHSYLLHIDLTDILNTFKKTEPVPHKHCVYRCYQDLIKSLINSNKNWINSMFWFMIFQPSRPASSRPGTRMSSGSTGPSETLLEILEKLGRLSDSHDSLTKRVEILEVQ